MPSEEVMEYWFANVERRLERMEGEVEGSREERWSVSGGREVRTCWIFLEPERWRSIEGHLMAAERSRWCRPAQAEGVLYSVGA